MDGITFIVLIKVIPIVIAAAIGVWVLQTILYGLYRWVPNTVKERFSERQIVWSATVVICLLLFLAVR